MCGGELRGKEGSQRHTLQRPVNEGRRHKVRDLYRSLLFRQRRLKDTGTHVRIVQDSQIGYATCLGLQGIGQDLQTQNISGN